MRRDLARLGSETFDVLVIGGGIYGLIVACDCAMRGLTVALIERHDFGSGASFNHLRTIHGGLRYLQTLDISRARESIRERRTLARIAPSFVQPQLFALPLTRSLMQGPLAMRAGFLLDAMIASDRNNDVPPGHQLPRGRLVSREQAARLFAPLGATAPEGAALWYDYVTTDADRLTLAWAIEAAEHGAALANYVEAAGLSIEGGRSLGAHAVDRLTRQRMNIHARLTVNAAGGAIDTVLSTASIPVRLPMLKAMNLVTSRQPPAAALGGRTAAGRAVFQVPWQGRTLLGTFESTQPCEPDDLTVNERDIDSFIDDLNYAFPSLHLAKSEITLVHRGVVPATRRPDGTVRLEGHEKVFDHSDKGIEGLLTVAGTKYTTARAVAERVTNRILGKLRRPPEPCRTASHPLPVTALTGDELLAHAARHEMVMTLEDAVVRRTTLGAVGRPADSTLGHAADVVGSVLGWDEPRKTQEIEAVRRFYGTSNAWKT